jgi:hypothetical protein
VQFPREIFEWKGDPDLDSMDSSQWMELFRLFVAAQNLHVSGRPVSPVAEALQDLMGQMTTKVLLVLRTLFLEGHQPSGPVHEAMKSFSAARQLPHQPVVIKRWEPQQ